VWVGARACVGACECVCVWLGARACVGVCVCEFVYGCLCECGCVSE